MEHGPCKEVDLLKMIICGNGTPGVAKQVEAHEMYIQQQIGSWKTIKATMVFLGVANVGSLVAFLVKTFSK